MVGELNPAQLVWIQFPWEESEHVTKCEQTHKLCITQLVCLYIFSYLDFTSIYIVKLVFDVSGDVQRICYTDSILHSQKSAFYPVKLGLRKGNYNIYLFAYFVKSSCILISKSFPTWKTNFIELTPDHGLFTSADLLFWMAEDRQKWIKTLFGKYFIDI